MTTTDDTPDTRAGTGDEDPVTPAHRIPMSSGTWRYSFGDDGCARGVYTRAKNGHWDQVAPLPHVTARLSDRDGDGRRDGVRYRLTMDMDAATTAAAICDTKEVTQGDWATKLDVPLSADRKIRDAVATAIFEAAHHPGVVQGEAVPTWSEGELVMPPSDLCPQGYMDYAADEDRAVAVWRELGEIIKQSPRLGLFAGAALAGLYVSPLERQPFILEAAGGARSGKSSGVVLGGAVLGYPGTPKRARGTVRTSNSSAQGMQQALRGLSVMPAFADETGAAKRTLAQKEEFIFTVSQGASRTVGTRSGTGYRTAGWSGIYLATGNESLAEGIANEGVWARVVSVPTPVTATPAAARRVARLIPLGYGWPLQWLMRRGMDPDGMAARVEEAEQDLPLADGGIAETLGEHLALIVAGARILADLVGVDFTGPVLDEARALVDRLMLDLAERGATPADRLMSAVMNAWATHPDTFPDLATYRAAVTKTPLQGEAHPPKLPPMVDGLVLSDPDALAVFPSRMGAVARESEITDPGTGLGDLVAEGRMLANHGRQKKVAITATKKRGMYVFLVPEDTDEDRADDSEPTPTHTPAVGNHTAVPTGEVPSSQPEVPSQVPNGNPPIGNLGTTHVTCENEPPQAPSSQSSQSCETTLYTEDPRDRPGVGNQVGTRRGNRPAPATPTPPRSGVLALAQDTDALYTYDHTGIHMSEPIGADDMGAFLDYCARAMPTGGTVALSGEAATALGYPEVPETMTHEAPGELDMPDRPRAVADAAQNRWHPGPSGVGGWSTFTRGANKAPDQVSITIACLDWMDAPALRQSAHMMLTVHPHERDESIPADDEAPLVADTAADAVYLLGRVRELVGTPWAYNGGSTWCMGVRDQYLQRNGTPRPDLGRNSLAPRFKANRDPEKGPVAPLVPDPGIRWRRPEALEGGNHGGRYVIGYDANAAHLATANRVPNAINGLREVDQVEWDPNVSGVWLMEPITDTYGDGQGPPLAGPAASTTSRWWAHTEQVRALIQHGLLDTDVFTTRAWVPVGPDGQPVRGETQVLRKFGEKIRDALKQIPTDTGDLLEKRVRKALKSMYKEAAGMMERHSFLYRPDWSMGIWSGSRTQILRTAVRVYDQTRQWPIEIATDCLYYETEGPDPEKHNPAPKILKYDETGTRLGHFKAIIAGSGTMAEYVAKRSKIWKGEK